MCTLFNSKFLDNGLHLRTCLLSARIFQDCCVLVDVSGRFLFAQSVGVGRLQPGAQTVSISSSRLWYVFWFDVTFLKVTLEFTQINLLRMIYLNFTILGIPLIHTGLWLVLIVIKKQGKVEKCLGNYYLEPDFWILDGPRMLQLVVS